MNETQAIVKTNEPQAMQQLSVSLVRARRESIVQLMREAMEQDVDYGVIPGCKKPSLYQPGAQKLLNLFQLDPEFEQMPDAVLEQEFILHSYKCTLFHAPSGLRIASGVGSCNSREEKYGKRDAKRKCPRCSAEQIIEGKEEYGGGFLCWKKKGGCGAKFLENDPAIVDQPAGKVPNENIWEQENTLRKMAQKRALIAATLNATGASDIFTQDVEDMAEFQGMGAEPKAAHRDGHEHATTFCRECTEAGIPENHFAVLLKGHIYLRDAKHEAIEPHEKYCPACRGKVPTAVSDTEPHGFKEWLDSMEKAKATLGEKQYYAILKGYEYRHANEVKDEMERSNIRRDMLMAHKKRGRPPKGQQLSRSAVETRSNTGIAQESTEAYAGNSQLDEQFRKQVGYYMDTAWSKAQKVITEVCANKPFDQLTIPERENLLTKLKAACSPAPPAAASSFDSPAGG